ncbi:MAG: DUF1127 domain-containing protein [Alphaproteobacteria bacterium]|nr:DUF1127 domain-containing protein [Alphaproteobacteria bacterium]
MAYVIPAANDIFHPGAAVQRTLRAFFGTRKRNAVYRATRNELMALSDRDLCDLGISRFDINRVSLEAAIGSAHN